MTDAPRPGLVERLVEIAHEFQALLLDHVHGCGTQGDIAKRYGKADAERLADQIQRLSNRLAPPVRLD